VRIRKCIGTALHRVLSLATIKLILKKDPAERTEEEIERIIKVLQNNDYFKKQRNLQNYHYRELSQCLKYKEVEKDAAIYSFGDTPQSLYLIMQGRVSEEAQNPIIDEWDWASSVYNALQEWKQKEFDVKV